LCGAELKTDFDDVFYGWAGQFLVGQVLEPGDGEGIAPPHECRMTFFIDGRAGDSSAHLM
jgi:hypothetical protein